MTIVTLVIVIIAHLKPIHRLRQHVSVVKTTIQNLVTRQLGHEKCVRGSYTDADKRANLHFRQIALELFICPVRRRHGLHSEMLEAVKRAFRFLQNMVFSVFSGLSG